MVKIKIKKITNKKSENISKPNNGNVKINIHNFKNVPVEPVDWTLQNKKFFPGWINKTFVKYQMKSSSHNSSKNTQHSFKPFPYQKFLRDYMQNSSPYRGVLLYHGLGSGKTCSSILIAENLKDMKNVIIMLPAALKNNFINEGLKFCGDKSYQNKNTGNSKIEQKYIFVSYNAPNKIKQLDDLGSLDNHVIIIEEVHNLISMMTGENAQGKDIYQRLMNANNVKIVALSGTPLQNFAFEAGILFNFLRGYLEETIMAIQSVSGNSYDLLQLEKTLGEDDMVDIISLNIKNKTVSVYLKIPIWHLDYKVTMERLIQKAGQMGAQLRVLRINRHTLFPEDQDQFLNYFIDSRGEIEEFQNKDLFSRRILGLVSYYESKKQGYPSVDIHPPIEITMSNYQYDMYELAREELERKLERLSAQRGKSKKKSTQKIPSNFRVYSRQFSNFVFPESIPRPFRKPGLVLIPGKKNKNNNSEENLQSMMKKESDIQENNSEISKDYQKRMSQAIEDLKKTASQYLTPEALRNEYSPKMARMLKDVQESPGLSLVYSNFRKMEGIEVFSQILKNNGYVDFMDVLEKKIGQAPGEGTPTYAIFSGEEDFKIRNKVIQVFTSPKNLNGKYIKILMITRAGAEGLDLKNIRRVLIMEPYWNNIRIDQVIGRAVRRNSHIDLPPKDRKVDVYIYQSVLSEQQRKQTKEKISTDQYIADVAQRKKKLINEILDIMKEMAVDCVLNSYDNEGNVKCFSFGEILDPEALAYLPKITEDLIYTNRNANRKKIEKVFTPAFIDENNLVVVADLAKKQLYYVTDTSQRSPLKTRPKSVTKVAVDIPRRKVYDLDSVRSKKGNPILLGEFNRRGEYVAY